MMTVAAELVASVDDVGLAVNLAIFQKKKDKSIKSIMIMVTSKIGWDKNGAQTITRLVSLINDLLYNVLLRLINLSHRKRNF
jgi:hypothetical protein